MTYQQQELQKSSTNKRTLFSNYFFAYCRVDVTLLLQYISYILVLPINNRKQSTLGPEQVMVFATIKQPHTLRVFNVNSQAKLSFLLSNGRLLRIPFFLSHNFLFIPFIIFVFRIQLRDIC